MSFFVSEAWAQNATLAQAGPTSLMNFLPLIILFVLFYFFLIRPQTKRAKEHKKMVESLAKGDEVVTNGGLLGRITKVGDNFIDLEIADGILVKVQKQTVATLMPKGTMKSQ
jgi:preprotein translocase subunit YajC